jgi:hypothetical protein
LEWGAEQYTPLIDIDPLLLVPGLVPEYPVFDLQLLADSPNSVAEPRKSFVVVAVVVVVVVVVVVEPDSVY